MPNHETQQPRSRSAGASTAPRSTARSRVVAKSVVAVLAVAAVARAIRVDAGLSTPHTPPRVVVRQPVMAPDWVERSDTVGSRQSLGLLLRTHGVAPAVVRRALDRHVVRRGTPVSIRERSGDFEPSAIVVAVAPDHLLRLDRTSAGWTATEERLPWTTDTVLVRATVRSTLAAAFSDAPSEIPRAQRSDIAYTLADIFEYRVDMSRDLQPGDEVAVLVERSTGPHGLTRVGKVVAAKLDLATGSVAAVRYARGGSGGEYFDAAGRSLRARFLRAPLAFRRVSSVFGRRRHPILGIWRQHQGTDYAAAHGTPVRAIGDGVVLRAGRAGGYGNLLEIRLRNGYVARYGHLRNFARGMRVGRRVEVGQTVAFVGTTGLSTAPHLHFEMLVNGRNRDPRVALQQLKGGEPIGRRDRESFEQLSTRLLATLDQPDGEGASRTAN